MLETCQTLNSEKKLQMRDESSIPNTEEALLSIKLYSKEIMAETDVFDGWTIRIVLKQHEECHSWRWLTTLKK